MKTAPRDPGHLPHYGLVGRRPETGVVVGIGGLTGCLHGGRQALHMVQGELAHAHTASASEVVVAAEVAVAVPLLAAFVWIGAAQPAAASSS
jgi:hypothetical protein